MECWGVPAARDHVVLAGVLRLHHATLVRIGHSDAVVVQMSTEGQPRQVRPSSRALAATVRAPRGWCFAWSRGGAHAVHVHQAVAFGGVLRCCLLGLRPMLRRVNTLRSTLLLFPALGCRPLALGRSDPGQGPGRSSARAYGLRPVQYIGHSDAVAALAGWAVMQ